MTLDNRLIGLLREVKSVVVVTGSGVSAESGIPTFRGEDGLWRQYRAEELATAGAFLADPTLVWEWYDSRRELIAKAEPNPAHDVVARMEKHFPSFLLVTQNVDGLHRKAGNDKIVEIHGNIWRVRCMEEHKEFYLHEVPLKAIPPKCDCGALLRPAVVWFGESLPVEGMNKALEYIKKCEALITVGTSGLVHPVASFPMLARSVGGTVIEINKDETPNTAISDFSIRGLAGEILPELWDAVTKS